VMVAYVKPAGKDSLRITFSRKGESDELRIADNGSCAVSMAMPDPCRQGHAPAGGHAHDRGEQTGRCAEWRAPGSSRRRLGSDYGLT
jgi:hypothetical protein